MDIVVTIPKKQLAHVEAEEADVAKREAAGEKDILYYWAMRRLPKQVPDRVYFVWDGAIRAFHDVVDVDYDEGRIYLRTKINTLENPIPMKSFMGFRYFTE